MPPHKRNAFTEGNEVNEGDNLFYLSLLLCTCFPACLEGACRNE
jgi:hypothetical protein